MQTILRFLFLLICLSLASCEPEISEKKDKAMNERKLSEIISLEHNKLLKETTQKISLLEKNTKKYLETLSDEDYSKWRKAWRSAHQSFIAITFLPINENFSEIEAWPLTPGFIDSIENYPYSGIVNDSTIEITPDVLKAQHMITDPSEISLGFHVLEYYAFERKREDLNGTEEVNKRRRALISIVSELLVKEIKALEKEPPMKIDISYPELITHIKDRVQRIHIEIRSAEHCAFSESTGGIVRYQLMVFNEIFNNTLEIDKYLEEISPDSSDEIESLLKEIKNYNTSLETSYLEGLIPKLIRIEQILSDLENLERVS